MGRLLAAFGYHYDSVGVLHCGICGLYHVISEAVLRLVYAGGIKEYILIVSARVYPYNTVSRCLRLA